MYLTVEKMHQPPSWWDAQTKDDQNEMLAYWRTRDKMLRTEQWYAANYKPPKGAGN